MDILLLLDRPIAYHRVCAELTGSVAGGVFLSQAIYWQRQGKKNDDGWWWHTQAQWTSETGLSRRETDTARKRLKSLDILRERKVGIPQRIEYRIDDRVLAEKIEEYQQSVRKRQPRMAESANQGCTKTPTKNVRKRQIPEIKPETILKSKTTTEIDEYCRLGAIFGGKGGKPPENPTAWSATVRKGRIERGGLTPLDRQQLTDWQKRESRMSAIEAEKQAEAISLNDLRDDPDARELAKKHFRELEKIISR